MNRRLSFVCALVVSSLAAIGCTAGGEADPVDESPAEQSSEALTTVTSSSGGDTIGTGTATLKPKETFNSCFSACKETRVSNGWCTAYCECKVYYKLGASYCAEHASNYYIDI